MIMDFGKETAIPHVSPCFFACCLLKQLSYQLQPPHHHSIQIQFEGIIFVISAILINNFFFVFYVVCRPERMHYEHAQL